MPIITLSDIAFPTYVSILNILSAPYHLLPQSRTLLILAEKESVFWILKHMGPF